MRHRKYTFKIGRTSAHRRALLANQASSLIKCGEIRTTLEKAKETRRFTERMITLAKKGGLHHRRIAISRLRDKDAVKRLFGEIAPKFTERKGGYTRIIKLGRRIGDAAETCILQFVEEGAVSKPAKKMPVKKADEKKRPPVRKTEKNGKEAKPEKKDADKTPQEIAKN